MKVDIKDFSLGFLEKQYSASVPFSLYGVLINNEEIKNPYYNDNETEVRDLSENDCTAQSTILIDEKTLSYKNIELTLCGIDTLADIYLNQKHILHTQNMHMSYNIDVKPFLQLGENILEICFYSPVKYVKQKQKHKALSSCNEWIGGFGHLRKANYSFGWDWGPQLPDMGIYREVFLNCFNDIKIHNVDFQQVHSTDKVLLKVTAQLYARSDYKIDISITAPDGKEIIRQLNNQNKTEIEIKNPYIWWCNGLGEQPLYQVVIAAKTDNDYDQKTYNIGLRTLEISNQKDKYGKELCFVLNGHKIFSMGGNYIPEDNILSNYFNKRTTQLLNDLKLANFNMVRVWGGGIYPDDHFYDECDRLGLIVWQDFMFACTTVYADEKFLINIREEFVNVLLRIRHHACLGLLCGNNEIETLFADWTHYKKDKEDKKQYVKIFEKILSEICREYARDIFYLPSSPTSGGGFDKPNDPDRLDSHFWEVWHGIKPFEEYRKHYFRFCSEFGFESFPNIKTLKTFAQDEELNPFSPIMENHQKCKFGNARIQYHIAMNYLYPTSFQNFILASQLIQLDAIKFGVEHMRRHRGRCMGALYWQINDCWPTASWSSIDYFGRWKALHYGAKRFYEPVLMSLHNEEKSIIINISNETLSDFEGILEYAIAENNNSIIIQDSIEVSIKSLSALDVFELTDMSYFAKKLKTNRYFSVVLKDKQGCIISCQNIIKVKPKQFKFLNPNFKKTLQRQGKDVILEISSDVFAKGIEIDFVNDYVLSDNYFDIGALNSLKIITISDCSEDLEKLSNEISIKSVFDIH